MLTYIILLYALIMYGPSWLIALYLIGEVAAVIIMVLERNHGPLYNPWRDI